MDDRLRNSDLDQVREWLLWTLLTVGLVVFIALPFLLAFLKPWHFPTWISDTASKAELSQRMFAVFALLPGLIGLGNYAVSQRLQQGTRRRSNKDLARKCSGPSSGKNEPRKPHAAVAAAAAPAAPGAVDFASGAPAAPGAASDASGAPAGSGAASAADAAEDSIDQCRPTLPETLVASVMLTGVFLVLAIVSWRDPDSHANSGLIYSGYGAYISTLWYLLARLNASALSPRFLVNSAVKASIAMFIGCAVGHEIFGGAIGTGSAAVPEKMLCFLIGLFHPMAMKSLKKTAIKTFGGQVVADADFPVLIIEGINDEAADLLEELGIASTQHLATANVPELAERSLYPQERILDWVDQAILAVHTGGRLREFRAAGIHSATEMIALAAYGSKTPCHEVAEAAKKRLKDAGERAGYSSEAMPLLVKCLENDPGLDVFLHSSKYKERLRLYKAIRLAEPDADVDLPPDNRDRVLPDSRYTARLPIQGP